jgi:tetratricopeptide (TPR) repeat protein
MPYYSKTRQLGRANELVMSTAQETEMPYEIASDLMSLLSDGHPDEIRTLFLSSLASFRNHTHYQIKSSGDFPGMEVKFGSQLPPALVRDAADEVLSQARKADEKFGAVRMNSEITSSQGVARFHSVYEFRLFQLMPVLMRLDPEEAKKLLQGSNEVRTSLSKYPNGLNSLGSDEGSKVNFVLTAGAGDDESGPSSLEIQRAAQISSEAQQHPQDALAKASTLSPDLSVDVYIDIARATKKQEPAVALTALEKAKGLVDKLDLLDQLPSIQTIASLYLQLGKTELAKDSLEQALRLAMNLYRKDVDAKDPDQAPKAFWPSTNAYRGILIKAQKIDEVWATTLLKEIPDDGIRVFGQIAIASARSNLPPTEFHVFSRFKNDGVVTMYKDEN